MNRPAIRIGRIDGSGAAERGADTEPAAQRGPVLLEFNRGGGLNLHQLAHDRGILTDEYREHLRRCGYKGKLA